MNNISVASFGRQGRREADTDLFRDLLSLDLNADIFEIGLKITLYRLVVATMARYKNF